MYVLPTYLSFTTLLTCSVYKENIIGGKFYVFVRCLIQKAMEMPKQISNNHCIRQLPNATAIKQYPNMSTPF